MKLIETINYVKSFTLKEAELWWNSEYEVFNNEREVVFKSEKILQNISYDNPYVFISDIESKSYLIGKQNVQLNNIFIKKTFNENALIVSNEGSTKILELNNELCLKKILNYRIFTFLIFENCLFYKRNKTHIHAYTLPTAQPLWQFSLEELGTYTDRDGKEQPHEVDKFIGVWNNGLLVACSGQLLLELDIQTGHISRKWQELKGFGTTAFNGRLRDKIPSANGFQLDITQQYLYHLAGKYLVKIELDSGAVHFHSLEHTMQQHVFSNFRWSTAYAEDDNHIYTIAEMNRNALGLDYIPQCLVALNKTSLQIDWQYRFEGDWIKTDVPQVSGNKLYQLSGDNVLYIFEKENT